MRRVPLRAALQITSLEKNKEYRQGTGKREGEQTGRVDPEAGGGEGNGRTPEAEAKRKLNAIVNPGGSGEEHGRPEDCVWLCWDVWVYLLSDRDCTAASSSLSNILIVINAVTWHV